MMNYHSNVIIWIKESLNSSKDFFLQMSYMKLIYKYFGLIKEYFQGLKWNFNFNEELNTTQHPSCVVIKINEMES